MSSFSTNTSSDPQTSSWSRSPPPADAQTSSWSQLPPPAACICSLVLSIVTSSSGPQMRAGTSVLGQEFRVHIFRLSLRLQNLRDWSSSPSRRALSRLLLNSLFETTLPRFLKRRRGGVEERRRNRRRGEEKKSSKREEEGEEEDRGRRKRPLI